MTDQIPIEEALKLVSFEYATGIGWRVHEVHASVLNDVRGNVWGTINGRKWMYVETPKEKLQRLIGGASEEELLKLINQLEDNND